MFDLAQILVNMQFPEKANITFLHKILAAHSNFFPNEVRLNIYGFNFSVVRYFFRYNFAQTNFVENFWSKNLHSFGYSKRTSSKVRKN
jgi:hypothetical protein